MATLIVSYKSDYVDQKNIDSGDFAVKKDQVILLTLVNLVSLNNKILFLRHNNFD